MAYNRAFLIVTWDYDIKPSKVMVSAGKKRLYAMGIHLPALFSHRYGSYTLYTVVHIHTHSPCIE